MKPESGVRGINRKGLHMVAFTTLAMATSCGLFQPAGVAPQVSNVQVVQSSVRVQAGNPGVTPGASAVQVQFNVPMNRPSVERSINVYPGTYDVNANPATFQKLGLTSMCDGQWRVRNPNAQALSFQWDVYGKTEKGVGVATANGDTFFQSTTGGNTVRVFIGSALQNTKATNPAACSSNLYGFAWTDSRTVQVTPVSALQANKPYTLAVSTAAKNEAGTQELPAPFFGNFIPSSETIREVGTLTPGGNFDFPNGSSVNAPTGVFNGQPIQIYSEKTPQSQIRLPLPENVQRVGDYFRIGAIEENITKANSYSSFRITLPVPEGEDYKKLAVFMLLPEDSYYPDESGNWISSVRGVAKSLNNKPFSEPADLFKSGATFVLVKYKDSVVTSGTQSPLVQTQSGTSSPFSFECDFVPCVSRDSQLIRDGMSHAFTYWVSVMQLNERENKEITEILITNNYSIGREVICRPEGSYQGVYQYSLRRIVICTNADGNLTNPEYSSDLFYHEMFHAVQAGLANGARRSEREGIAIVGTNGVSAFLLEGTAAVAGGSATSGNAETTMSVSQIPIAEVSRAEFSVNRIIYTLQIADSLDRNGDQYRTQDLWAFLGRRLNRGINLLKPLFQIPIQERYGNNGAENARKVDVFIRNQGYQGGLKQFYWDYVKNQAMEVTTNLRNSLTSCNIERNKKSIRVGNRIEVEDAVNLIAVDYNQLSLQANSSSPVVARHLSSALWDMTFSNLPTSGGDVRVTLRGGNNDVKAVVYKVKQQNPSNCANTPDLVNGTGVIRGVMPDERLVVLAGNTSFDQAAPLQVEVQRLTTPDMDDGTLDGNQLSIIGNSSSVDANNDGIADSFLATDALRYLSADFTSEDADGNGRIGNGRVDMADFRRLRDLLLRSENLGTFGGSATQPKLNVGAGSSALKYADFNGNGTLRFNDRVPVPGLEGNGYTVVGLNIVANGQNYVAQSAGVTRNAQGVPLMSDFEVFYNTVAKAAGTWVDADFTLPQTTLLLGSGDLEVWTRDLFDYPGVVQVASTIENASFNAGFVHTRTNQRHVYTAPPGTYFVRLAALDVNNDVIVGLKKTVTIAPGQDVLFAPATALNAVVKTTYNSTQDDCARLQGVYSFNAPGLFDSAAPEIPTNDIFMALGQNLFPVREQLKRSNWPLQLESGTYRHCNFPNGQARLTWNLNYDFFGSATPTGFIVQTFKIITIENNRWPGFVWNSTDLNDPQGSQGSVPLKITVTSTFPGDPLEVFRLLLPGTATPLALRPITEASYRIEAVDDDQNPATTFNIVANSIAIPYLTDGKVTYRGRSAWHHQIFCDFSAACTRGGAGIQSLRVGPASTSLTEPAEPAPVIAPRPRFNSK